METPARTSAIRGGRSGTYLKSRAIIGKTITQQRSRGPHWPGASKAAPTSRRVVGVADGRDSAASLGAGRRIARCDEDGARFRRFASYCGECKRVSALATVLRARQARQDTRLLGPAPLVSAANSDERTAAARARARARAGAHAESRERRGPLPCRVIDSGRSVKICPCPFTAACSPPPPRFASNIKTVRE